MECRKDKRPVRLNESGRFLIDGASFGRRKRLPQANRLLPQGFDLRSKVGNGLGGGSHLVPAIPVEHVDPSLSAPLAPSTNCLPTSWTIPERAWPSR